MNRINLTVDTMAFVERYQVFEKLKAPDPILAALQSLHGHNIKVLGPEARAKCVNIVAYWRTHAKPGKVLAALKSRHYVQTLGNWRPPASARAN